MFFLLLLKQNVDGELFDVFLKKLHQEIGTKCEEFGIENSIFGENLEAWLKELGVDKKNIEKILHQDLKMVDFQNHISRDDLKVLLLPLGQEIRIWANIMKFRNK